MLEIPVALQPMYEFFDDFAPSSVWVEVAGVFSSAFSVAPYFEDPAELSGIVDWGQAMLAGVGGRLVTARCEGRRVGFSLVHGLDGDSSWEGTLSSMATANGRIKDLVSRAQDVVIVHELAVDSAYRGRGIAKTCLELALGNRNESSFVLGVYEQAQDARRMYERWGFEDLGATLIQDGAVSLRVLAAELDQLRFATAKPQQVQ